MDVDWMGSQTCEPVPAKSCSWVTCVTAWGLNRDCTFLFEDGKRLSHNPLHVLLLCVEKTEHHLIRVSPEGGLHECVGLLVCWFVGLLVCWFVGLVVCLRVCCLRTYAWVGVRVCLSVCVCVCVCYIHYMHSCVQTNRHTSTITYLHTYHTYIHACIHTCIRTYRYGDIEIPTHTCLCMYDYVCVYIYISICAYIYIYMYMCVCL